MSEAFGKTLKKERLAAGKSMGQVARAIGTTVAFISRVENGKAPPLSRERILQVAAILRRDPQALLAQLVKHRQAFEVPMLPNSPKARRLAIALMRATPEWTDDDFERAIAGIDDDGGEG